MKFTAPRRALHATLKLAQSVADAKSTLPILGHAKLVVDGDKLTCAATDLNVSLSSTLAIADGSDGELAVGAKQLADIVAGMPGDTVTVRSTDKGWCEVTAGKVSYRVVALPTRDFPKVATCDDDSFITVDAGTLREMIDRVLFSVCNDETRFHLNGALFESSGPTASMISTDGHRLSKVDRALGGPMLSPGVIIPRKGLIEIKHVLDGADACDLAFARNHAHVQVGGTRLAVKLIDAQFPPVEQVIPKEFSSVATVDRVVLLDALKRAGLMSSDARGVTLTFGQDRIGLVSTNPDVGDVREDIDAEHDGKELTIGLNPKYLIELLGQIRADQVTIGLGEPLTPIVVRPITGDDYLGVVMPMRVS